jgi:hypothetical protein
MVSGSQEKREVLALAESPQSIGVEAQVEGANAPKGLGSVNVDEGFLGTGIRGADEEGPVRRGRRAAHQARDQKERRYEYLCAGLPKQARAVSARKPGF